MRSRHIPGLDALKFCARLAHATLGMGAPGNRERAAGIPLSATEGGKVEANRLSTSCPSWENEAVPRDVEQPKAANSMVVSQGERPTEDGAKKRSLTRVKPQT
jgi:hypothetical protein